MKKEKSRTMLSLLLFAAAIGMCVYGAAGGQARDVFIKAINICMECIGLG